MILFNLFSNRFILIFEWSVNVSLAFFNDFFRGGGGGVFGLVLFIKILLDGVFRCVSYMFEFSESGKMVWVPYQMFYQFFYKF